MNFKTPMFQLIQVVVNPTGAALGANAKTYFDNQPQLQSYNNDRTVYIKAIESFSDQAIAQSPLTSGIAVATATDILNATLTLVVKGVESFQYIPLSVMNRIFADTANFVPYTVFPMRLKDVFEVDWAKSYVTTITPLAAAVVFLFGVHYSYTADWEDGPYLEPDPMHGSPQYTRK